MILIDPELELSRAADALNADSAKRTAGPAASQSRKLLAKSLRLPSTRTLARFLAEAQAVVHLRGQVTVLLTSDATMRDLNRRFRGKNKPTDVLSFPAENLAQNQNEKGDVAISVETALRQSVEQGHTLGIEIKVLMLHGVLHLAGYDHETDAGEMQRRERFLRARLKLPPGLIERASRRDARILAPDGVRRGTRRTQSGESQPHSSEPRRGGGSASAPSARRRKP